MPLIEPPTNGGETREVAAATQTSIAARATGSTRRRAGASRAGAPGSRSRPAASVGLRAVGLGAELDDDDRTLPGTTRAKRGDVRADARCDARACGRVGVARTSRCSSSRPTASMCAVHPAGARAAGAVPQTSSATSRPGSARCSSRAMSSTYAACPPAWPLPATSLAEVPGEDRRVRLQLRDATSRTRRARPRCCAPCVVDVQLPGESTGPTPCQTRMPAASRRSSSAGLERVLRARGVGVDAPAAARRSRPCRRAGQRVAVAGRVLLDRRAVQHAARWPLRQQVAEPARRISRRPTRAVPRRFAGDVERAGRRARDGPGAQSARIASRGTWVRTVRSCPAGTVTGGKRSAAASPAERAGRARSSRVAPRLRTRSSTSTSAAPSSTGAC